MEILQKVMSGFSLDLGPVKEPLGFIRILEWIFTICAFATTGGYVGSTVVTHNCGKHEDISAHFGYPFRLPSQHYDIAYCNKTTNATYLQGDFSSSAEFFVAVGVLGFLYCTFTLILYLGYQHVYRESNRGPTIDLIVTGIFAFLWLVCSSAWGKGLTDVKFATDPERLIHNCLPDTCTMKSHPSMGRLNASVLFGFLNLILWAGNCWFIYKETPYHKPANPPPNVEEGVSTS
ncbi:synaptophysin-like protein 2a isoform X1 [Rhinichthys klamathensis goyatoka]|uniref:synaptophysin-like protein 2a isoform X1 n=2 Tax=Rhinichthys klamathensis goyatoka TaxID=3034132 RepID=UPI0024B52E95|nr:synaptophysin-like protein 2a isoform X1 [Rhinichthys klamathensis goyatoka]